jgi:ferrous iron transport protein A
MRYMFRFEGGFRHGFRGRFRRGFGRGERSLTLAGMKAGQSGIVGQIPSGYGIIKRLGALGIRPGLKVTKVNSSFMRGPVTVQFGNTQVAIGYGMANRIVIEPIDSRDERP